MIYILYKSIVVYLPNKKKIKTMPVQTRSMTKALQKNEDANKIIQYLQRLQNELGFSNELLDLYLFNITDISQEFGRKEWKFHSPLDIFLKASNYPNFIDIASRYIGMGWIEIIAFCPKTKLFFYRCDGGSNGFEVEHNQKIYTHFDLQNNMEKALTFKDMLTRTFVQFSGLY